nr:acyltransferase family protein [Woeseiaceae bacterium]
FDANTPFPGVHALVPTVGTVLIILFGTRSTWVGRLLSIPFMVTVGLVSYSAYLWHQPLFAFARIRLLNEPGAAVYLALSALAIVLAYLSWRYVEAPFRNRRNFSRPQVFTMAIVASGVLIAVGLAGHVAGGFQGRLSEGATAMLAYREDRGELRDFCDAGVGDYQVPAERCTVGADTDPTIAIVGDSHARELAWFLGEAAATEGLSAKVLVYSSCPPIRGVRRIDLAQDNCPRNNDDVFAYLRDSDDISHVVLAARWTLYLETDRFDNGEGGVEHGDPFFVAPIDVPIPAVNRALVRRTLPDLIVQSIEELLAADKTVIVVYPVPEVGWNVPEYLARAEMYGEARDAGLSTSYARFKERNELALATLDSLGERDGLIRVRPHEIFCDSAISGRCLAQDGGLPLYFDDDHLNSVGAEPVVERILEHVTP